MERPPSRPMVNYPRDQENEEDYEIGWQWIERDTGPYIAPYTGFRQCLLDPTKNNPEDFFEALFTSHMYTIMAEETNKYAHRKLQRGKYIFSSQNFIYKTNYSFLSMTLRCEYIMTRTTHLYCNDFHRNKNTCKKN